MQAVWKFCLGDDSSITLKIPKRAEILAVQSQFEDAMLWALVHPENEVEERTFVTVNTGEMFEASDKKYMGTYQTNAGNYVYHVFEVIEPK